MYPGLGVAGRRQAMLPSPADSVGGAFRPRIDTGEVGPPSVTEHTTNFLGQK